MYRYWKIFVPQHSTHYIDIKEELSKKDSERRAKELTRIKINKTYLTGAICTMITKEKYQSWYE